MTLLRWPLLAATLLLPTHSSFAQTPVCESANRKLQDGSTITIDRARDSVPSAPGCEVLVKDAKGKTILHTFGVAAQIHETTGRDIDGDGRPDVVIRIERGLEPDNWGLALVSIALNSALQIGPATLDFETIPGHALIWTIADFPELDPDEPPVVRTAREFGKGSLTDVTPTYCPRMIAGELRGPGDLRPLLNALLSRSKQASRTNTGSPLEREQAQEAARSLALQEIYCGQIEDASQLVLEVWPAAEQSRIRRDVKKAVINRWPELAQRLKLWD